MSPCLNTMGSDTNVGGGLTGVTGISAISTLGGVLGASRARTGSANPKRVKGKAMATRVNVLN